MSNSIRRAKRKTAPAADHAAVPVRGRAQFAREVERSEIPVIIDFWAPWCQPCLMQAPVFEQVAREMQGKVKFVKVDVDASPEVAQLFDVRSIPTLVAFNAGEVVDARVGLSSAGKLRSLAKRLIGESEPGVIGRLFGGAAPAEG